MKPEGNHSALHTASWLAGGAFVVATAYQIATAPSALADESPHDTTPPDASVIQHDSHVSDPLNKYTGKPAENKNSSSTSNPTEAAESAPANTGANSSNETVPAITQTGIFNLPASTPNTVRAEGTHSSEAPENTVSASTAAAAPSSSNAGVSSSPAAGTGTTAPTPRPSSAQTKAGNSSQESHGSASSSPTETNKKPAPNLPGNTGLFSNLPVPGQSPVSTPAPKPAPTPSPETQTAPVEHFARPITFPDARCTSKIGWRELGGTRELHKGYDIAAPLGTPIYSATDGVVLYSRPAHGYGNWEVIQAPDGVVVTYGHMKAQDLLVKAGDTVKAGQLISRVGAEGQATGPHLHFQMNQGMWNGPLINPEDYLRQHGDLEICQFPPAATPNPPKPSPEPSPTPTPAPTPVPAPAPAPSPDPSTPPASSAPASSSEAAPRPASANTGIFNLPVPGTANNTVSATPSDKPEPVNTGIFNLPLPGQDTTAPTTAESAPTPAPSTAESPQSIGLNQQQLNLIHSLQLSPNRAQFLTQVMAAALHMNHQGYKENPEAMVAQAIIESRYGESGLAKYNNFFGMKAKEGTPPSQYVVMGTWEYGPNGRYWVPDAHFLRFDSPEAGLLGYDNFIKARYWFADALNYTNDPSGYIHAFMNTDHGQMAWATSPTYYDTLMNCIHSLKLSEIVAAGR